MPRTIGVRVIDGVHSAMNTPNPQTNYASRYWNFSDDLVGTGYTLTQLTFNYPAADQVGTLNTTNDQINRYDNPSTTSFAVQPTNSLTSTTAQTISGVFNQNSAKFYNNDYAIRNVAPKTYEWLPTSGTADWTTPSNWNPARYSPAASDILLFNQGGTSIANYIPANETIAQFTR